MGREAFAKKINKAVFPGLQGGPHMHTIAAKAVCFKEAAQPDFKEYAANVVENARALSAALTEKGFSIVSGGTDSHVMLVDMRPADINGKDAEAVLGKIGLTCNKNTIPFDPESPFVGSGIRLGTPALTTRGMQLADMQTIAGFIADAIASRDNEKTLQSLRESVKELSASYPLYRHRL
jgi:glycine hydroxymethyltransferase